MNWKKLNNENLELQFHQIIKSLRKEEQNIIKEFDLSNYYDENYNESFYEELHRWARSFFISSSEGQSMFCSTYESEAYEFNPTALNKRE